MVKLTVELIQNSLQHMNPVRDRELDLRGYKIPMLENLGATLNQFDTIDFTDNDIRKLDNFPLLPRLKCLLMSNNRVKRINPTIAETIPNLESLVLTNNMISELSDIDCLTGFQKLTTLSLLFNPVSTKEHYRLYTIYKLPSLRLLDFRKVKQAERDEAKALFKSKTGKKIRKVIEAEAVRRDEELNEEEEDVTAKPPAFQNQSEEQVRLIQEAIAKANSLEEIERLNALLRTGQVPQAVKKDGPEGENEEQETNGHTSMELE
jgi:U2 small nuclear ribonucleoprotein A'